MPQISWMKLFIIDLDLHSRSQTIIEKQLLVSVYCFCDNGSANQGMSFNINHVNRLIHLNSQYIGYVCLSVTLTCFHSGILVNENEPRITGPHPILAKFHVGKYLPVKYGCLTKNRGIHLPPITILNRTSHLS